MGFGFSGGFEGGSINFKKKQIEMSRNPVLINFTINEIDIEELFYAVDICFGLYSEDEHVLRSNWPLVCIVTSEGGNLDLHIKFNDRLPRTEWEDLLSEKFQEIKVYLLNNILWHNWSIDELTDYFDQIENIPKERIERKFREYGGELKG